MKTILKIFGCEIFDFGFNKSSKPEQVYNNCYFDYREPVIEAEQGNANNDGLMTKQVKSADYNAICEVISDRVGIPPEKVDEVLKISGEFIKNL